jgi:cilia- and flagella-associated protein 52
MMTCKPDRKVLVQMGMQIGANGCVRMAASSKDHRGPINAIAVAPSSGIEAVSASSDGACIIWDISDPTALRRRTSCLSNAFFTGLSFFPDDSQMVTVGSDRKLTFWDTFDGSAVRVTSGSDTSALSDVHIDAAGRMLASAGGDGLVQVMPSTALHPLAPETFMFAMH